MRSLDQSVQRLSNLASKLNEATDKLNEHLAAAERRLSETRIGLDVWLNDGADRVPADPIAENNEDFFIVGWTKLGEQWRLVAQKFEHDFATTGFRTAGPQPLMNAPRHVRMRALPMVVTIVERLGDEAERWLSDVEKALAGSPTPPSAFDGGPPIDDDIPF